MALIKQYQSFKGRLGGYTELQFDEFRSRVVPLRQKKKWSAGEEEYVRTLVSCGAGHALQLFLGANHSEGIRVLGAGTIDAEPMTKADLDAHMRTVVKSCHTASWPPERFVAFASYLDSTQTPKDIVAADRARREKAQLESSMFAQTAAAKKGGGTVITDDDWDSGEAPEDDKFAAMYRGAGPAFKLVVQEHLACAAADAKPAPGVPTEPVSDNNMKN